VTGADALYQAILEDPEDDVVRLVYADWCEEHGLTERAEHIRLQIEQARLPKDVTEDSDEAYRRRREIEARLKELGKREKEWLEPLRGRRGPLRGRDVEVHFHRGFPHRLTTHAALFLERAPEVFRKTPIAELHLKYIRDAELEQLIHTPGLARVTSLHLSARRDDPVALGRLGLSEHLRNLQELELSTRTLTPGEASLLADAPALAGLKRLDIYVEHPPHGSIEGDALQRLAGSRQLRDLEAFSLSHARLDGDTLGALAGSPLFARLLRLSLSGGLSRELLAPGGLQALVRAPLMERLEALNLGSNRLDAAGVSVLASVPSAPALRTLGLHANPIGDEGVAVLARSASWPALRWLNLQYTGIGPEGARALADSPHLDTLTDLFLNRNPIGDAGARALAASPHLAGLRSLDLGRCQITAEGARALAESPYLGNLHSLELWENHLEVNDRKMLHDRFGDVVRF
jgi:uncharacterized protein (TIGR02996 family)